MLLFHEGLPGAGKSYAAIKDHVVPALVKGRKVFAYIEGLDHKRIAEVSGITEERCRELLFQIERDQVPTVYEHVQNDSLVVIDELQDFWPSSRVKLEPKITEFVTQHRHRGLDVLLMGQVLQDCHVIWRNRVDQNVFFYTRDAIGKPDEYKWSVRKRDSAGKFREITSGVAKYDPAYFGTYASHTSDTENLAKYEDKRANVWSSSVMRRTLPIYLVLALVAGGFVYWVLGGGGLVGSVTKGAAKVEKEEKAVVRAVEEKPVAVAKPAAPAAVNTDQIMPPGDIVDQFTSQYRIRIGGLIRSGERLAGWVEWREEGGGVREVLSYVELAGLGWLVMVSPDGGLLTLSKLNRKYYATAWPTPDARGRMSDSTVRSLQPGTGHGGGA